MNIKTMSEVFFLHACRPMSSEMTDLKTDMWNSLAADLSKIAPEKALFAKALGQHQKDPMRILAMLFLNLSNKELSELQMVLGTLEPTQPS